MARKPANQKKKKQPEPEPQSESSVEQIDVDADEEEDIDEADGLHDEEDFEDNSELLKLIEEKIQESETPAKLSWTAIHNIKRKQATLNEQMADEIENIKDKYELLKNPLINKISAVVAGQKIQKQFYHSEIQGASKIDEKVNPEKIQDYWQRVFQSCGILGTEADFQTMGKCEEFRVDLIDSKNQHLKIHFKFSGSSYFSNKVLALELKGNHEDATKIERTITEKIKYSGEKDVESMFTTLFDEETDPFKTQGVVFDLFRAYSSSTYFYFHHSDNLDFEDEDDEGSEGEEGDEEEESEEEDVKPVKKNKKGESVEKPECKQQ